MDGAKIVGFNLTDIRYADDIVHIGTSAEKLQSVIDVLAEDIRKIDLQMNKRKTFSITLSKKTRLLHMN